MSSMDDALPLAPRRSSLPATVARLVTAPRFLVYCCCTLVALLACYHLGKDMAWDTLDYHFYAGFSALHDRLGQDYFPAGPQSYFNPYIFVPFYLLNISGLTALQVALILAAVQSAILWLVYELALAVAPPRPRARVAIGICSVALAFANPVLINQFGSSFADVLTAEVVIAGWLLLVGAVRTPSNMRIACAALLLGCAAALKLTNAVHALSACAMVLFIPGGWRARVRRAALFAAAGIAAGAAVAAPWAIGLERHFGNPFFPLLNGIFRSPQFTTARIIDYRFIPTSLGAALWRPFALVAPNDMIHVEWAAPDLRYALLLLAAALSFMAWGWKRRHGNSALPKEPVDDGSARALAALGSGFLIDWVLWLTSSGNGRYFIPMACVAAVLAIALIFRVCSTWPKLGGYVLVTAFLVQFYQLHFGTQYSSNIPWDHEPWFQVTVPESLASKPGLYFSVGVQSNSFIAPYLAPGSGLINLGGDYTLGPDGAVGKHIEMLVRRYSPNLQILIRDGRRDAGYDASLPKLANANDALEPFGLRLEASNCQRIVVHGISSSPIATSSRRLPVRQSLAQATTAYYVACQVVTQARDPALVAGESKANSALDHLEDACPALFQPRRPASYLLGDSAAGYIWAREYGNTGMLAWVDKGWMHFQMFMGQQGYAGPESAWERAPLRVACRRGAGGDYSLRVVDPR
jgi:hypothetical protein